MGDLSRRRRILINIFLKTHSRCIFCSYLWASSGLGDLAELKCCARAQTSHFPIPLIASSRDCTVVSARFSCARDLSGHPAQQQGWEESDSESALAD